MNAKITVKRIANQHALNRGINIANKRIRMSFRDGLRADGKMMSEVVASLAKRGTHIFKQYWDEQGAMIRQEVVNAVDACGLTRVTSKEGLEQGLDYLANLSADVIDDDFQSFVLRGRLTPADAPSTVKRKGHGTVGVDTGELLRSIEVEVL